MTRHDGSAVRSWAAAESPSRPGILDVEHRDVGSDVERSRHDLVAHGRPPRHLEIALQPEQRDDRAADEGLVLRDEQTDHARGH
jgi:hypothetical protein